MVNVCKNVKNIKIDILRVNVFVKILIKSKKKNGYCICKDTNKEIYNG